MKEKVLRNTQFQNMHGIGEIKRAQEQRIDVVSAQKFTANHETIQQLTAQLQQMQEQMNSMTDSVDFKMWNQIKVRFRSTCDDSVFSCFAQPQQKIAA